MKITVTGATGFLGGRLVERLGQAGHQVHVLGRRPVTGHPFSAWDSASGAEPPEPSLAGADAVIHLAGEPVAQRWSPEVKQRIRDSRVKGTRALVQALSTQSRRPAVLLSGSAIGIYGDRGDEVLTERSQPGTGFLAGVTMAWEREAELARSLGIRVVLLRTGIVLGKNGGALKKMLPPFRAGAGGPLGGGKQWMSWIHVEDICGLMLFALEQTRVSGALNGTAPAPETNQAFTAELAKVLHRPAILPVPRFGLKLLFGEMAEVLFASQRVIPQAALDAGYRFHYPSLEGALASVV